MPRQEYECPDPEHGKFVVETKLTDEVKPTEPCPWPFKGTNLCNQPAPWVPPLVGLRLPGGSSPNRV